MSRLTFEIAKFDGTKAPVDVYFVSYAQSTGTGKCSCRGYRVHGKGNNDKHILMIKEWLDEQRTGT